MRRLQYAVFIFFLSVLLSLTACGGGGSGSSSSDGTLSLQLTDATTNDYKAVYVTISKVKVCVDDENEGEENSWLVVAEPGGTYNLLDLVNGVQEYLGITELEAGQYTQMRLMIGSTADGELNILGENHPYANYVVDNSDAYHELKVPSGVQTGIKLVSGFSIYENQTTELILDFDASRSVVKAGNSGNWLLKPVIKVVGTTVATVSGNITDEESAGLEGIMVSVQMYDSVNDDVIFQASTITDEYGNYVLFVEPGEYSLVAYGEGYDPQCSHVELEPNSDYVDENLSLVSASAGTLAGAVSVVTELEDPYVSISVREATQCEPGVDTKIEIVSVNVANGESYSINLPSGSYEVVARTEGYDPMVYNVDITGSETTSLAIDFGS